MTEKHNIAPSEVRSVLRKHLLVDGYDMVLDFEKSRSPYIYDSGNKKRFLDFFTFFASNPLGMNYPKVVEDDHFREKLLRAAMVKPTNADIYTTELAEFVDTFDRIGIPSYLPHLFFISGGALAVENALKVAFDWKVQKNFAKGYRTEKGFKVLHLKQAFHGRTGYTMSLTNTLPEKVMYFPKFDWPRIDNPKMIFPMEGKNEETVIQNEKRAILQAERYFEMYPDEISSIILEPIQAEGGDNHFRPEFHRALRRLADQYDALLIYDEVQTGVGLTGKFWAYEHFVKPDILAFGKKMQVCGILVGSRIDEVETNVFNVSSRLNSTWAGNLVDMVRMQKYLEVIEEDHLVDNAAKSGDYLLARLRELAERHEYMTQPRGKGLMCAFDMPNDDARTIFLNKAYELGVIILSCGENTVRFRPPLSIQPEHIDEGLAIIEKALEYTRDRYPSALLEKTIGTKTSEAFTKVP